MADVEEVLHSSSDFHVLIHDVSQLELFHELFIDLFKPESVFMHFLVARKKYSAEVKVKTEILNRTIVRDSNADEFIASVRRYESSIQAYQDNDGQPLPTEMLVIYCTLNPRDALTAWRELSKLVTERISESLQGKEDLEWTTRIDSMYKSRLHSSKGERRYIALDVDDKEFYEEVSKFLSNVGVEPYCIIETRGGYHFILKREDLGKHISSKLVSFLREVNSGSSKEIIEMKGDPSSPLPGTYQGGFPVRILSHHLRR